MTRLGPAVSRGGFRLARRHGRGDAQSRGVAPCTRERKDIGGCPGLPIAAKWSAAPGSEVASETCQEDDRPPRGTSSCVVGWLDPRRANRGVGNGEARHRSWHRSNHHRPGTGVDEHVVERRVLVQARRRQHRSHSRLRPGPRGEGEEVLVTATPVRHRSSLRDPLRRDWKLVDEDPDLPRSTSAICAVCTAHRRVTYAHNHRPSRALAASRPNSRVTYSRHRSGGRVGRVRVWRSLRAQVRR